MKILRPTTQAKLIESLEEIQPGVAVVYRTLGARELEYTQIGGRRLSRFEWGRLYGRNGLLDRLQKEQRIVLMQRRVFSPDIEGLAVHFDYLAIGVSLRVRAFIRHLNMRLKEDAALAQWRADKMAAGE